MNNKTIEKQKIPSHHVSQFGPHYFEQEKQKLASELHDNVASKLAIIKLKLHQNPNCLNDIILLIDHTINSVRYLSHNLYKPELKHITILDAIRDFVLPLNDIIKVEINCLNTPTCTLNHHAKLNLFRIAQEVIHNILKHANATHIAIKLFYTDTLLQLTIGDNGLGFINKSINNSGIGMKTIEYRAKAIKANYQFIGSKNNGTVFLISLPITHSNI